MDKPSFTLHHAGINAVDQQEAAALVEFFCQTFDFASRPSATGSSFAGECVEVMAGTGRGTKGHLAFYTPDINAAIAYLQERGIALDPDSAKYNSDGSLHLIYFKEEIGGFAIHILGERC